MHLSARSSVRRLMSFVSAVVIRVSLVLPQAVRDVWDGLMQLQQDMAAVCREQQALHLQYLTR